MLSAYENAVNKQLIFNVFKNLRNTDIHEMTIGTHISLHLYSPINFTKNPIKPEAPIREENKKRSAERQFVHHISRPLASNNDFIDKLRNAGQTDLADAAVAGKTLYESVEFEGEADMFIPFLSG